MLPTVRLPCGDHTRLPYKASHSNDRSPQPILSLPTAVPIVPLVPICYPYVPMRNTSSTLTCPDGYPDGADDRRASWASPIMLATCGEDVPPTLANAVLDDRHRSWGASPMLGSSWPGEFPPTLPMVERVGILLERVYASCAIPRRRCQVKPE
jgi:hypothetical protein